jgi:hypothetical protein
LLKNAFFLFILPQISATLRYGTCHSNGWLLDKIFGQLAPPPEGFRAQTADKEDIFF